MPPLAPPDASFGALLKRLRQAAGLSQEALAERAAVSAQAISALESGARRAPHRDTVARLARGLRLAPGEAATLEAAAEAPRRRAPAPARESPAAEGQGAALPSPAAALIGRERETAAVADRLRQPAVRLLTLTGPGGVGKTRLALHVAAGLRGDFPDGVRLVSLASLRDAALVLPAVAQALDVREGRRPLVESLRDALRDKALLLVLDNFEHVLGAAVALANLLDACPTLKALTTSRAALRLAAEHEFAVPPLPLPARDAAAVPDELSQFAAVRLFLERARAVRAEAVDAPEQVVATAEICRRLDGLPLAIELAAARVRLLPPSALLGRLERRLPVLIGGARDLPPRHQTLRAAIGWSDDLLGPDERTLFRRLAVFDGGCTVEAAEAVCCPAGDGAGDALAALEAIAANSLVEQAIAPDGQVRLRMLETIREYAAEQLAASPDAPAVQQRHARYYTELAEATEPALLGPGQEAAMARLTVEDDNLRAALRWAAAADAALGLRLAAALGGFWEAHADLREGRQWLERLLGLAGAAPAALRAKALTAAGALASLQGEYGPAAQLLDAGVQHARAAGDAPRVAQALTLLGNVARYQSDVGRARALLEEGLAQFRALGDRRGCAGALNALAELARYQSEHERSRQLLEECLAHYRALADARGVAAALSALGLSAQSRGAYEAAQTLHEESLRLRQGLGDKAGTARSLSSLGEVARHRRQFARAVALNAAALALQRELGDQRGAAWTLNCLGWIAYDQGDYAQAAEHYEETLARWRALGHQWGAAAALVSLGRVARCQGEYDRATALLREGLALFRAIDDLGAAAYAVENLAGVHMAAGRLDEAAVLLGGAEALRAAIAAPMAPHDRREYDRDVALLRGRLAAAAYAAAWAAGRVLTPADLIARALAAPPDP